MKSMRKLLSGETTPPILECGEAQLQAALTMEARSRTPLPPSPTTQHLQDHIISGISVDLENKLKLKSDLSVSNKNKLSLEKPIPNPKPSKPSRKYPPINRSSTDESHYEPDESHYEPVERSYDEIEYRNNAWQTMGIASPSHTEQVNPFISFFQIAILFSQRRIKNCLVNNSFLKIIFSTASSM